MFILIVLLCSMISRTPIDTLAIERSDSGNKYVQVRVPHINDQTVYTRYVVENIPANTVTDLIDSAKGSGSVYIPPMLIPSRYALDLAVFSHSNTVWEYTLKVDSLTLFTAQSTASKIQIRTIEIYASPQRNKLYLRRTNRGDDGSVSTIDSANVSNWGTYHRVYWTIKPNNPATLLGVRGTIQH